MPIDAQRLQAELGEIKEMRIEGMCGGRPMIAGTRISVRTIVERTRLGDTPEQIVEHYPPLTLAQIHDALSYYHEHKAELEAEVAANREALAWVTKHNVQ